jgi:hypothetical protein
MNGEPHTPSGMRTALEGERRYFTAALYLPQYEHLIAKRYHF